MYSNDQNQIKQGLVNYIGALLSSSPYSDLDSRQNITAILLTEILKLSEDEDGLYNLYVLKPLFRTIILILKQRCVEMSKLPIDSSSSVNKYNQVIMTLEELLNNIQRS